MKLKSGIYNRIQTKIAPSLASLQRGTQEIAKTVKKNTKAILAMSMIAGGAHALSNESNTHYGSHVSSSSEWSIVDRDDGELDLSDIEEILGAKIHYQSKVTNQQTSHHESFIKMPHAPAYKIDITQEQQETIQQDINRFKEEISQQLRSDLSQQAQNNILNPEGVTKLVSIFTEPKIAQRIDDRTSNITGSASFVGDQAKNSSLAANRGQYIRDLLDKNRQEKTTISTDTPKTNTLTDTEQSQLEAYAKQAKTTTKNLIREHNLGKKFSQETDKFLSDHLEEKQGVYISSDVHFTQTITHDLSLSAYWLVLAGLGITFRKKIKTLPRTISHGFNRVVGWSKKFFAKKGSANDARERVRENLEKIRGEVDDPRVGTDTLKKPNIQETTYQREPQKTWRQKFTDFFQKKSSPKEIQEDTNLSSDIVTERLKTIIAKPQQIPENTDPKKVDPPVNKPSNKLKTKQEPYKQERWRTNARRAIDAFDTILEKNPELSVEKIETLRELMKKEAWDVLEYEIRGIVRQLRNNGTTYKNTNTHTFLEELDAFTDTIAQRELFGRGYIGHTMSPYFVQKDINNMRSDPIAERIKNISKFTPTTKIDLGNGSLVYLSNRVRAMDGAKNDHIAFYALHEGKLTGYIFEESRTTGEWKLLPSKQCKHGDVLQQITTKQTPHRTESLGSPIHTLNPDIIAEVFRQPLGSSIPRNEIIHILHAPNPTMESMAKAA